MSYPNLSDLPPLPDLPPSLKPSSRPPSLSGPNQPPSLSSAVEIPEVNLGFNVQPDFNVRLKSVIRAFVEYSKNLTSDQLTELFKAKRMQELSELICGYLKAGASEKGNLDSKIYDLGKLIFTDSFNKRIVDRVLNEIKMALPLDKQLVLNSFARQIAGIEVIKVKKQANLEEWVKKFQISPTDSPKNIDLVYLKYLYDIPKIYSAAENIDFEHDVNVYIETNLKKISKEVKKLNELERVIAIDENDPPRKILYLLSQLPPIEAIHQLATLSEKKIISLLEHPAFSSYTSSEYLIDALKKKYDKLKFTNIEFDLDFKIVESDPTQITKPQVLEMILGAKLSASLKYRYFAELQALSPQRPEEILKAVIKSNSPPSKIFKFLEELNLDDKFYKSLEIFDRGDLLGRLIIENAPYALEILRNPKYDFKNIDLSYLSISLLASIPTSQDNALAEVINTLITNPTFVIQNFFDQKRIEKFIQRDLSATSLAIIKNSPNVDGEKIIDTVMRWDSVECLKKICEKWKSDPSFLPEKMIELAATSRAPKCLSFLVPTFGISQVQKNKIADEAAKMGYADMVLSVCNQNMEEATKYIFAEIPSPLPADSKKALELFEDKITRILRFTSIEHTDAIFQKFLLSRAESEKKFFVEKYHFAKEYFLNLAPFIARNVSPKEIKKIANYYTALLQKEDVVVNDYNYAAFSKKQVTDLLNLLKTNKNLQPKDPDFAQLPPSSSGSKRAAALLEVIASKRSEKQLERAGVDEEYFRHLRSQKSSTPVAGHYQWAEQLIWWVQNSSKAMDKNTRNIDSIVLTYNDKSVNSIVMPFGAEEMKWYHGQQELDEAWPAIEDKFEEILKMDMSVPKDMTAAAKLKYQERLTDFYAKASELVWLIGNTQPLSRGSGTVAEWFLALVHMYHGLKPPVLKTEFPQLDVLDITFPLSDYKKFFTYFFEPSTIPEHLRRPAMSNKSLFAQLEKLS